MGNPELAELKDTMAKEIFGITVSEAHGKGICVQCQEPALPKCHSDAGVREYCVSGFCEECFDKIFRE